MMSFRSKIFILPGLGNSGDLHWQTLWEKKFPDFTRIHQQSWDQPVCEDWISTIDTALKNLPLNEVILVGHSLACCTIGYWSIRYKRKIRGALMVAPSDTEAETYRPALPDSSRCRWNEFLSRPSP
ncbi:alpha/beta hydrolase [Fulvivirgaceae bacterium PWU4]|uniref:Alpha/beta hydrolase n=1 Tax=Chryseosolibacter histidini TaxID=2782349 RepID=A0AAP2GRK9_9BACT|nr:alpha/beta hydrolase [Chryseosolibacter histidini]MBT1699697.1 alpha/beta hydrolase [Chryseosolibacter histidini]